MLVSAGAGTSLQLFSPLFRCIFSTFSPFQTLLSGFLIPLSTVLLTFIFNSHSEQNFGRLPITMPTNNNNFSNILDKIFMIQINFINNKTSQISLIVILRNSVEHLFKSIR